MKKKMFILMIFLIVVIAIVGSSYAYLKAENVSSDTPSITLSNFGVILLTDISSLSIDKIYPMTDDEGLLNQSRTFQIQNTGTQIANYKVSLVDNDTIKSTMKNESVRYQLKRTNETTGVVTTFDITNLDDNGLLDSGSIEAGTILTYEIIMWIDYDSNPNGQTFSKVVLVEGMQISSLDKSGANYPELLDNMIPVYYDATSDTEGVWRVADSKNLDSSYQWFDYDNFMWANAVTVNKDVMDNYYGYSGPETVSSANFPVSIETNDEIVEEKNITTYTSTNKTNSTTSSQTFSFTTQTAGVLTFDYTVSSETNYDKLTITINDGSTTTQLVSAISGTQSGSKEVDLSANTSYTLTATYSKDSSQSAGNDEATISAIEITATLASELTITEDATYPWSSVDNTVQIVTPEKKQLASTSYTYNEENGQFTLTNPTLITYTSSNVNYYTCNSNTKSTCVKLYQIKEVTNDIVTKVDIITGSTKGSFGSVLGQEVKMDDITSMWVWIPRYKYVIFNGNNGEVEEQLINVTFEHGIDKTGTVTCVDNITTSSDSSSSETCTDATNGSIVNNVSTYTHPAFTFGDEELTGFWFAKFEMSTDDTTCLTSQSSTNCSKSGLNIYVKPDNLSLIYISISNLFSNTRGMELSGNIHGFNQSDTATTLNSDGSITNDSNNYDIHMEKNMEWGAVAYLSQSKYGKYGNTLYEGDYRRIYKNNYYLAASSSSTGGYEYKTGYSGYSETASSSTTNTVLYNDLTNLGSGRGYKGAGASTTGTIYGIYDMNGGAYDFVMGNMVNTSGTFYSSSAGFTSPYPDSKYYDRYSYSTSSNSVASRSRSKLGDGVKETIKNMANTSTGAGWGIYVYRDLPNSSFSWFRRGGYAYNTKLSGVFYSSYDNGDPYSMYSSRPVLAVSRDFPWLVE